MTESFLSQLVFWSLGYGSFMGFSFAPILMLHAQSWSMRFIILGFSVPTSAFLTSAVTVSFYAYGSFMLALANIMTQPVFLHSMLHTFSLSVSLYCAYRLLEKAQKSKFIQVKPNSSNESETESESSEQVSENAVCQTDSESSDVESENEDNDSENQSKNSNSSDQESENEDNDSENQSENSNSSDVESEKAYKSSEIEWRKTANFEGVRNAPPLLD